MLCKAFLREEGGSRSETKGACVIDGVTSPSELLDYKVRLRGIYVCGDSSALQALARPTVGVTSPMESCAAKRNGEGFLPAEDYLHNFFLLSPIHFDIKNKNKGVYISL